VLPTVAVLLHVGDIKVFKHYDLEFVRQPPAQLARAVYLTV
jgi:hypothetical protein